MRAELHAPDRGAPRVSLPRVSGSRPATATPAGRPTRFDSGAILAAAWRRYRVAYGGEESFYPDLFAAVLEREWAAARFRLEHGAEEAAARREAVGRRAREPRRFLGSFPSPNAQSVAANRMSRS